MDTTVLDVGTVDQQHWDMRDDWFVYRKVAKVVFWTVGKYST